METFVWKAGVEHEIEPGKYVMLVDIISDWTVWRFETANGVYPTAGKPAVGGVNLTPLGVAQALYGGKPSMQVHFFQDQVIGNIRGTHLHTDKAEMRIEGERFVQPIPSRFDPLPYDGKRLEVFISSMPTERSFTKIVKDQGVIDLTGIGKVVEVLRQLEEARPQT